MKKAILALFAGLAVIALAGCPASEQAVTNEPGWLTHESAKFGFAVDYPADWPADVYGEKDPESPQAGIRLQIEGNPDEWLDVFGQHGTFNMPFDLDAHVSSERFRTNSGLKGTVSIFEYIDEVHLIYSIDEQQVKQGKLLCAIASVSKESYDRQKDVIDRIIASLR